MKPTDLLRLLDEFFREKAALRSRHLAAARVVGDYDFNNTYQYVIAREDHHLAWVGDAVRHLGGQAADLPTVEALQPAKTDDAQRALAGEDARSIDAFVQRWRPRVAAISNARERLMLELTLGEMLEQSRLLSQASGGRLDLLGRRTGGERTGGEVLPTRWVE